MQHFTDFAFICAFLGGKEKAPSACLSIAKHRQSNVASTSSWPLEAATSNPLMPPLVDIARGQAQYLASKHQMVHALKERTPRLYYNLMVDGPLLGSERTSLSLPDFNFGFHVDDAFAMLKPERYYITEDAPKYTTLPQDVSMKVFESIHPFARREFPHFKWVENYPGAKPASFNNYGRLKDEYNVLRRVLMLAKFPPLDIGGNKEVCTIRLSVYCTQFGYARPSTFRPKGCATFSDFWEA